MRSKLAKVLQRKTLCFHTAANKNARKLSAISAVACSEAGKEVLVNSRAWTGRFHASCTGRAWHSVQCMAASGAAAKTVLLVESPAKAKKIQTFLGADYQVRLLSGP